MLDGAYLMFHKIEIPAYVMYTLLPIPHLNTLFCVRLSNIMEILYIRNIACITSLRESIIKEQEERVVSVFGSSHKKRKQNITLIVFVSRYTRVEKSIDRMTGNVCAQ